MPMTVPEIPDAEKIMRFDKAYQVLADLSFKAPEARPANAVTVELLGDILHNGKDPW